MQKHLQSFSIIFSPESLISIISVKYENQPGAMGASAPLPARQQQVKTATVETQTSQQSNN